MVKAVTVLSLAALSTAFVLPDQRVLQEVEINHQREQEAPSSFEFVKEQVDSSFEAAEDYIESLFDDVRSSVEDTISYTEDNFNSASDQLQDYYSDAQAWASDLADQAHEAKDISTLGFDIDNKPHHGHKHHKPNQTVYELIAKSKYTTKLAKLINEYPDLVEALNGTAANYTVFAPTDHAFEKIPKHAPKPSKDFLKKILTYHVSADFYPAGRVLATRTIPTLLKSDHLGPEKGLAQRLFTKVSFRGLLVNLYSRVVAINIFGTNGVIHGVDSILLPPPSTLRIIDLFPTEYSTLELGLGKTGLLEKLNTTHAGGTFFAPNNYAFQKLGPRINAFLFSPPGLKYLKALLEYHVVPDQTLYSDAYYSDKKDAVAMRPPQGVYHYNLPTLLKDRSLSIDVARYGRLIEIKINAFSRVTFSDVVAEDGVIHQVSNVLIPPKESTSVEDEELTLELLMDRLEPCTTDMDEQVMMDL